MYIKSSKGFFESKFTSWLVWSLATSFYLYEFFVRVSPGVIQEELQIFFNVSAAKLGGTMAFYYYIYAPMQLIVGVLFDRLGAKSLLVPASCLVAVGCCLFAFPTEHFWVLGAARFLMGLGSAFGFVGVLYLASVWFPHNKIAMLSGLTTAAGMLGAMIGEAPLALFVESFGWRKCFLMAGVMGVAIAWLIFFFVPTPPAAEIVRHRAQEREENFLSFLYNLKVVLLNPTTWTIGVIAGALYMPLAIFGDIWGVPYVIELTGSSKTVAAGAVSMLYLGWLIGGPVAGWVSDKIGSRKKPLVLSCLASAVIMCIILFAQKLSLTMAYVLFLGLGFASCSQVISFVASMEDNPKHVRATSIASINMIVMLLGGLFEWIIGIILDLNETHLAIVGKIHTYSGSSYRTAMLVLPVMLILALILSLFMKETASAHKALEEELQDY
jgi:MFS family permease